MIYDSLDKIPYKIFLKIAETGDVSLLSDTETNETTLESIWNEIFEEHLSQELTSDEKRIFNLKREIEALLSKQKTVLMAVESLAFEYNDDLYELLTQVYGYELRKTDTDTFNEDLERIERETSAFKIKIKELEIQLPKENKDKDKGYNIDDVMASYSMILGFDFEYNTITYTKYFALQKQVTAKVKSLEKQNENGKF